MPAVTGELLTIEEAQRRVLERVRPLASESVPLERATGRILAEAALAATDLPPFPSSAMDGFALRSADTPGALQIAGNVAAGRPAARSLQPGEAMSIATGGAVPDGADAVVPVEYVVSHDDDLVEVPPVLPGANVRPRGGDVRLAEAVVGAGVRLRPAQIGALAAAGVAQVVCGARPRAAVLTTGTELRPPGQPLGPGEIFESNGSLLAAALEGAGASVERLSTVEDDEEAHREAIRHGLAADVLVTSGGVSVGPHDLVRKIAGELGVEEVFWGVAMRPGKPLAFGVRERTLVFGLPGNPVSSLVGFELFVKPAVLALQGAASVLPELELGRLARAVRRNAARDELVRARRQADETGVALEPLDGQESHMIVRAAEADVLVLVPRGDGELLSGAVVRYLRLS